MDHRPIGIIDSTQHKNHLFNQEILYLPSLVYVHFSLPKCNIWIVMQLLLQISLYLFYLRFRNNLLAANHLIISEGIKYDTEQKSSKLLLDTNVINK